MPNFPFSRRIFPDSKLFRAMIHSTVFSAFLIRISLNRFSDWVKQICREVKGVVSIDGKLMRGPSRCNEDHPLGNKNFRLWIVSAWSKANGISLGQEKVGEKSNEITAIPRLLAALDISDCIITIDAMGCQSKIIQEIIERKGDYVIALKKIREQVTKRPLKCWRRAV